MRSLLAAAGVISLALGLAPRADAETIHACAHRSNGKLRIVATTDQCKNAEIGLSWSSTPGVPALVGFTVATVQGYAGVLDLSRACHAEFAESRICSTAEVAATANPPAIPNPSEFAWVLPTFVADGLDATGYGVPRPTCAIVGAGALGLVVDGHGRFSHLFCSEEHRVACCAPRIQ